MTRRSLAALAVSVVFGGCATATSGSGAPANASAASAATTRCHARGSSPFTLPDPRCTPGRTDPRVTPDTVQATICRRGYTRRVRPPESVTEPQKLAAMTAYGDTGSPRRYEYDHLIPLELGGAPDDGRNLWPEPGASPNPKDRLERALRRAVCRGTLALGSAQHEIATDWVAVYHRRIG